MESITRNVLVTGQDAGLRLDQAAARLLPEFSRTRLQQWIREGKLRVNGEARTPRDMVFDGDTLDLQAQTEPQGQWTATAMDLAILYEDESILVIDKPVGLVVHPAAGHADDTLLNGLLEHCPALAEVPPLALIV